MRYYKLEQQKLRPASYRWAVLGMYLSVQLMGMFFLFIPKLEELPAGRVGDAMFSTWSGLLGLTTALHFACFSVFAATLAAKLVVKEYCGAGAEVLLSYPVPRRRILRAKCAVFCTMTVAAAALSNSATMGGMYLASRLFQAPPQMDVTGFPLVVVLVSLLMGVLSAVAGLVAAVVGWKKRSPVAAVVGALLLVCCTANGIPCAPRYILWVMLGMACVFLLAAALLYRVLARWIEGMEV